MFKKKALVKLIIASLVFAAFDIWIFTSLLGSYRKHENESSLGKVTLFAKSISAYHGVDEWIASLPKAIEGGQVLLLGIDENYEFSSVSGDALANALWETRKGSPEFEKALESVYYLLPYRKNKVPPFVCYSYGVKNHQEYHYRPAYAEGQK